MYQHINRLRVTATRATSETIDPNMPAGSNPSAVPKPSVDKEILMLVLPALCAVIMDPLASAVDTFWVGKLPGATSLAAMNPNTSIYNFIFMIVTYALAPAVTTQVNNALGKVRHRDSHCTTRLRSSPCLAFARARHGHPVNICTQLMGIEFSRAVRGGGDGDSQRSDLQPGVRHADGAPAVGAEHARADGDGLHRRHHGGRAGVLSEPCVVASGGDGHHRRAGGVPRAEGSENHGADLHDGSGNQHDPGPRAHVRRQVGARCVKRTGYHNSCYEL
eukprot:1194054-Prorocentrum_minimum.AAC.1